MRLQITLCIHIWILDACMCSIINLNIWTVHKIVSRCITMLCISSIFSPYEIFHYFINHFFSKCRVFISYAFFMPFWQIYWCLFWNKTLSKYLYDESESYILANKLFLPFFLIIQLYNCDLRQSLTSFADFLFTQCTQKLVYKTKKGPRKISLSRLWHV